MGDLGVLGIYILINYILKEAKNKLLLCQTNIYNTLDTNVSRVK